MASGLPDAAGSMEAMSIFDSHFTNEKTDMADPEPQAGPWESQAGQPSAPFPSPEGERVLGLSPGSRPVLPARRTEQPAAP